MPAATNVFVEQFLHEARARFVNCDWRAASSRAHWTTTATRP